MNGFAKIFKLYIYRRNVRMKEMAAWPGEEKKDLLPFGITNALFSDFLHKSDVALARARTLKENRVAKKLAAAALKKPSIYLLWDGDPEEALIPVRHISGLTDDVPPEYRIILEVSALSMACILWLSAGRRPKYKTTPAAKPSERYAKFWGRVQALDIEKSLRKFGEAYHEWLKVQAIAHHYGIPVPQNEFAETASEYIFFEVGEFALKRQEQLSSMLVSLEKETVRGKAVKCGDVETYTRERRVTSRLYTTGHGLFPLAWAEVFYAVENDIYAMPCKICGNWFPVHPKQSGQQIYCSPECRSESKRRKVRKR